MQFCLTGFSDEISPDFQKQIEVLKKFGIAWMEIRGVDGRGLDTYPLSEIKGYKRMLDENGIRVSSIASPIGKTGIEEEFHLHFEHFKHVVRAAQVMESRYIRIFSFYMPEGDDIGLYEGQVADRLIKLHNYAALKGIILLHENEKGIYGDSAVRCLALLKAVNGDHLKAVFDPANFVQCSQNVLDAYKLLKHHIAYVHIKDALKSNGKIVPAGEGDANIPQLLSLLKRDGYEGFISLEPHLAEFVGLRTLERQSQVSVVNTPGMSGEEAFQAAYDALNRLLHDMEGRQDKCY